VSVVFRGDIGEDIGTTAGEYVGAAVGAVGVAVNDVGASVDNVGTVGKGVVGTGVGEAVLVGNVIMKEG